MVDEGSKTTTIATTARTTIRTFAIDDAADLHVLMSDPEVARYAEWEPYSWDESQVEAARLATLPAFEIGRWAEYALELTAESRVIGCLTMRMSDERDRQVELGWFLVPAYQGRGLALEAVRAVMRFGLAQGAHRFSAGADARNLASIRLMERLGMRLEAHLRENACIKGEWCDEVIYAVLARELVDVLVEPGADAGRG